MFEEHFLCQILRRQFSHQSFCGNQETINHFLTALTVKTIKFVFKNLPTPIKTSILTVKTVNK